MHTEAAFELAGTAAVAWPSGSAEEAIVTAHLRTRRLTIASGTSEVQRNNDQRRRAGAAREASTDRDRPFREVLGDRD